MQNIEKKCAIARLSGARCGLLLMVSAALTNCKPASEPEATTVAVEQQAALMCGDDGHLQAELYGAISAELEWHETDLECTGMPRPGGQGARLRFAGNMPGEDRRIAVIIAIPDLQRETINDEYASNVTLIEEGSGRFFSTSNLDNCLTDITSLNALDASGDRFSIGGLLYCVAPLPEVNGDSSVSITELKFSGLLDWSAS